MISYYEQARFEALLEVHPMHLQIAERLASVVPTLDRDLQLGIPSPRRRWLERAQWIDERLRKRGIDLDVTSRVAEALSEEKQS